MLYPPRPHGSGGWVACSQRPCPTSHLPCLLLALLGSSPVIYRLKQADTTAVTLTFKGSPSSKTINPLLPRALQNSTGSGKALTESWSQRPQLQAQFCFIPSISPGILPSQRRSLFLLSCQALLRGPGGWPAPSALCTVLSCGCRNQR